ncbi:Dolichyl-diphosphooligosaccharide--protein glycosyltransferase subunit 1 [Strongyloides ratti]|uniref:Dolichyl-diphosphooligosaccharide--protein glycosyltransferase subunit 1 n=1 Tax=Strongyloides ratti TaxID=34506 RepID=A0A090L9B5_STRRB|nr:Dolichyl-diphosphooligosaccharide--protein glycosyltransferase subunit 1 [Strongyloides ratti]CEF64693.1 Dolichyl-diphosphooligosaccharide--protein glycosyltransferase subunit 1 [Strongyloides ratti]
MPAIQYAWCGNLHDAEVCVMCNDKLLLNNFLKLQMYGIVYLLTTFFLLVASVPSDLEVSVTRDVDISSQIVKNALVYTIKNNGKETLTQFVQIIPKAENDHLAYISAKFDQSTKFKVSQKKIDDVPSDFVAYNIDLSKGIPAGGSAKLTVEYKVTQYLTPYPEEIRQLENQFMLYKGSSYTPSYYNLVKDSTTYKIPSGKVHSYTTVSPSKQSTGKITYGPYNNIKAFDWKDITIHYENNSPFVVVTHLTRWIEVSHWGNIAVEDSLEVVHRGAKLVGGFSRVDYAQDRRRSSHPSVASWTTQLPKGARDIYYRDEVGNISTSEVLHRARSVDVEITPRFPLFGGWKTDYILGYNLPSSVGLFYKGNDYTLKLPVVDKVFSNFVIEKVTVKVVLPERSSNIKLVTPFSVTKLPADIHFTFLDTVGRPVTVFEVTNVVDNHVQNFSLSYKYSITFLFMDVGIAIGAFATLFAVVIFITRLDFSIVKTDTSKKNL